MGVAINYERYKSGYYNQGGYAVFDNQGGHVDPLPDDIGYLLLERAFWTFVNGSEDFKWSKLRMMDSEIITDLDADIMKGK